jgi:hypothetical protein
MLRRIPAVTMERRTYICVAYVLLRLPLFFGFLAARAGRASRRPLTRRSYRSLVKASPRDDLHGTLSGLAACVKTDSESINDLNSLIGTWDDKPRLPLQFPNSESDECLLSFEFDVAVYPVVGTSRHRFPPPRGPSPAPSLARPVVLGSM